MLNISGGYLFTKQESLYERLHIKSYNLCTMKTSFARRSWALVGLLAALCLFGFPELVAQCPMCRATAESNLAAGGTAGRGLNAGILYMLAMPYLLVGTLAFLWLRNRRKAAAAAAAAASGELTEN